MSAVPNIPALFPGYNWCNDADLGIYAVFIDPIWGQRVEYYPHTHSKPESIRQDLEMIRRQVQTKEKMRAEFGHVLVALPPRNYYR